MAYTLNPHLPKVRRDAVNLVRRGWGVRQVARRVAVSPGTITKLLKKAKVYGHVAIPTLSSKPTHHPKQLSNELVWKIFHKRLEICHPPEADQLHSQYYFTKIKPPHLSDWG